MPKVVIDAGHGGSDYGASYMGRKEKDDNLNLAFAVGSVLEANGIDVVYTRVDDVYDTPFTKAVKGNEVNADLFISLHRDAANTPGTGSGVSTLVYNNSGQKATLAKNISNSLSKLGFKNRGVFERPNLVVLKRTKMPSVLIETGFIDNAKDNDIFDENFDEIAHAIATEIIEQLTKS